MVRIDGIIVAAVDESIPFVVLEPEAVGDTDNDMVVTGFKEVDDNPSVIAES